MENKMKKQFTSNEILEFLNKNGIIDLEDVESIMLEKETERFIKEHHKYTVFCGKDGRWRTYVKTEGKRKLLVKTEKEALYSELVKIYGGDEIISIKNLYSKWLDFKRLHTNAETYIVRIEYYWKRYYKDTELVEKPLIELTRIYLDEWAHRLIKDNQLTKKQYYNISMIIRQILDYAVDYCYIDENVFRKVRIDRRILRQDNKKESRNEVFTENEETLIKKFALDMYYSGEHKHQPLTPLAILFMFQTGMRSGEVCALRWEDIKDGYVNVNSMVRFLTKEVVEHTKGTYGDRKIPLTDEAIQILELAAKKSSTFVFSVNDTPLGYDAIRKAINKYCDILNIDRKSSHKIRKTVISSLIDSGMNIDSVRRIAGHTDERITYRCYCYDRRTEDENIIYMNNALSDYTIYKK